MSLFLLVLSLRNYIPKKVKRWGRRAISFSIVKNSCISEELFRARQGEIAGQTTTHVIRGRLEVRHT